jgi:hypothetical protein
MSNAAIDSLESVEMLMALEEQLENVQTLHPRLGRYIVEPFQCQLENGASAWVIARYGVNVLFASFEQGQFGVGAMLTSRKIRASQQLQSFEGAVQVFLGKGHT